MHARPYGIPARDVGAAPVIAKAQLPVSGEVPELLTNINNMVDGIQHDLTELYNKLGPITIDNQIEPNKDPATCAPDKHCALSRQLEDIYQRLNIIRRGINETTNRLCI